MTGAEIGDNLKQARIAEARWPALAEILPTIAVVAMMLVIAIITFQSLSGSERFWIIMFIVGVFGGWQWLKEWKKKPRLSAAHGDHTTTAGQRMPIAPSDFETIKRHLAQFASTMAACPICNMRNWGAEGISISPGFEPAAENTIMGQGIPKVEVICNVCGFVRQFAWLTVKAKMDSHGK